MYASTLNDYVRPLVELNYFLDGCKITSVQRINKNEVYKNCMYKVVT